MNPKADAHLHFFRPGYVAHLPEACRRVQPDEVTLYEALAAQHGIIQVLAVGYEGEAWARGNNQYLTQLAAQHAWIRPLAFLTPNRLALTDLSDWQRQAFVGISLYLFDVADLSALAQVPPEVWSWLEHNRWLISVNSRGESWQHWQGILARHRELRLLISHLGLPAAAAPPTVQDAQQALAPVLALACFPQVRVKLSGFYALTSPGYAYPHVAAWPYVTTLLEIFGADRLVWGSDFAPSLEWVSFPQTWALFAQMPFLKQEQEEAITGGNLLALLQEVVT